MRLIIGNKYKFLYQPEILIFIGTEGSWHQFELQTEPNKIWCELLDSDLKLIVPIKELNHE